MDKQELSPDQEKKRAAGSAQGLYTPELRSWGAHVIATFEDRWVETPGGFWKLRDRVSK